MRFQQKLDVYKKKKVFNHFFFSSLLPVTNIGKRKTKHQMGRKKQTYNVKQIKKLTSEKKGKEFLFQTVAERGMGGGGGERERANKKERSKMLSEFTLKMRNITLFYKIPCHSKTATITRYA